MVTWQIVVGLGQAQSFRGGSAYPFPFNYFVNVMEFFMLDLFTFFHTECVQQANYTYKLAMTFVVVLSLGVLAVVVGAVCVSCWGGSILRSSSVKNYILLIYLVLPMMSSMAFSAFSCDKVK